MAVSKTKKPILPAPVTKPPKRTTWELADLAGIKDIAEHFGYGVPAVSQWQTRYPDFPAKLIDISGKPVYSLAAVAKWHFERWGI